MNTPKDIDQNSHLTVPNSKDFKFAYSVADRERLLGFCWRADYEKLEELIGLPPSASKKMGREIASIVANVAKARPLQRSPYSRSRAYYEVPARYRATDYGYETVVGCVEV